MESEKLPVKCDSEVFAFATEVQFFPIQSETAVFISHIASGENYDLSY